jgi:hypothetical protein
VAADLAGRTADQDQVLRSLRKLLSAYERCLGLRMEPGEGEQLPLALGTASGMLSFGAVWTCPPCSSTQTVRILPARKLAC